MKGRVLDRTRFLREHEEHNKSIFSILKIFKYKKMVEMHYSFITPEIFKKRTVQVMCVHV